ncbi:hypothetical protein F443_20519 [Phytophthora nicotianae P1569]|uniref:Uncharacterized protein n=1 Tax=Phytophthora nicotianae P1569 TaxID=1317065 RepID=V9E0W1_PHYNI|nr:hypothetical protein F443_20519 [Phytophthora nicotianae P1569]
MTTTPKGSDGEQETFFQVNEPTGSSLLQGDSRVESTTSHQTARVPHPIFAIVNPPKVSSMARAALVKWLKLRKEYEEYTKDRCKDGKEDISAVMKSVKRSFDASVLETLCEVCWGVDQSTVTDEFLLEKIHEITDSFQNQELPDVKELFQRGAKEKCKLIVNSLPKGLKNKVQNEQDYRVPEAKSDIRKLYELVRVKAKEQAIEERALQKANPSRKKNERKEQKSSGNHQNKRRAEQNENRMVKKVKQEKDSDRSQQKGGRSERSATKGAPKEGCFHCVETQATQGGTAMLKRIGECFPQQDRVVVLEDEVEIPLCIDSGADRCCLDESCFDRLVHVKPEIVRIKLDEPLNCTMADGTSVCVDWTVKFNVRLRTIAGNVHVAEPVECLIIPGSSGEFLLGNDLLIKLGIDVERQLELLGVPLAADKNGDEFDDADEPAICDWGFRAA